MFDLEKAQAAVQDHDECEFRTLSSLWTSFNAFLLSLAASTSPQARDNAWIRPNGRLTLEFLMEDYYSHLRLHMSHYAERLGEVGARLARA